MPPPPLCKSYAKVPNQYGPYACCSLDKAVDVRVQKEKIAWRAGARKGNIMHNYPQNQSAVGSSGQTLTTNVSMTLCNWQTRHETHVLCGRTTFGTKSHQVMMGAPGLGKAVPVHDPLAQQIRA